MKYIFTVLPLFPVLAFGQSVKYNTTDWVTAQRNFEVAQVIAKSVIESDSCQKSIKKNIGELEESYEVPIYLVDNFYYGIDDYGLLEPLQWDDPLLDLGNCVCARFKEAGIVAWINIPEDTIFAGTLAGLTEVIVHETLHYLQCQSGKLFSMKDGKSHLMLKKMMEKDCAVR